MPTILIVGLSTASKETLCRLLLGGNFGRFDSTDDCFTAVVFSDDRVAGVQVADTTMRPFTALSK